MEPRVLTTLYNRDSEITNPLGRIQDPYQRTSINVVDLYFRSSSVDMEKETISHTTVDGEEKSIFAEQQEKGTAGEGFYTFQLVQDSFQQPYLVTTVSALNMDLSFF